jgi:hypothetical protein
VSLVSQFMKFEAGLIADYEGWLIRAYACRPPRDPCDRECIKKKNPARRLAGF